MCPVCQGRGEVEAGVTGGTVEYGPVYEAIGWRGNKYLTRASYPTRVEVNPAAWDKERKTVWILDKNVVCELWGIAVCVACHGTGMV